MNNEIQAMDIINSLKEQIAELAYQVSYRDGVIKAQERTIEKLKEELEYANRRQEAATAKVAEGDM